MQDRLSWTQAALARILRPAVRLALAMGLKHPQLEEVLRDLLVDEARNLWNKKDGSKPNLSQLATTTGLNRKDVTARVRDTRTVLPATESSAAAKAYTAWLQVVAEDTSQRTLPLADSGDGHSFELLSRFATRGNVHHRTVLEELQRLNLVTLSDGEVHLLGDSFTPTASVRDMLAFLGDNVRDHLQAAVSNTLGQQPRMLERAVFASGLSLEDCERIQQLSRQQWEKVHHLLVREMTDAVEQSDGQGAGRMRVGIYAYYEKERDTSEGVDVPAEPAQRNVDELDASRPVKD
ncbi:MULTISPECIES: DUF6502 family protein [unclassified Acidovorax]|uniref:DUF6502 family protein n=1 Tax=unclassified Acidovorax TaxID=2684926 RepID=UPI0006F2001B|nr:MULTISPECIES: DUF6502 family protein [unclassified Acidovorax]KRB26536.1 hypothetical protein ASD94_13635 [Acidovorax sp. Root70]